MGDPSIIKPELEQLLQEGTSEEIKVFLDGQHNLYHFRIPLLAAVKKWLVIENKNIA